MRVVILIEYNYRAAKADSTCGSVIAEPGGLDLDTVHGARDTSVMSDTALGRSTSHPRWAVIKDARRRQRRRRRRVLASIAALLLATAAVWESVNHGRFGHPAAPPPGTVLGGVRTVPLSGDPLGTTTLRGNLWVLTCTRPREQGATCRRGDLTEIRAASDRVLKRTTVQDPTQLAGGAGAIWITHQDRGDVSRIDPVTGQTTDRIQLRLARSITTRGRRRFVPSGISFGAGRIWVSSGLSFLAEIDPRIARVTRIVWTDSEATSTTAVQNQTWIADELAGVGTLAPGSNRVVRHQITWAGQPVDVNAVAHGAGLIWALGTETNYTARLVNPPTTSVVTTINPQTGRIVQQWRLPGAKSIVFRHGTPYIGVSARAHFTPPTGPRAPRIVRLPRHTDALAAATAHALWATTDNGQLLRISLTQP